MRNIICSEDTGKVDFFSSSVSIFSRICSLIQYAIMLLKQFQACLEGIAMREISNNKWIIMFFAVILFIVFSISSKIYANIQADFRGKIVSNNTVKLDKSRNAGINRGVIVSRGINNSFMHKKEKRWLHGKPAIVNILIGNPRENGAIIKPSYGSYFLNNIKRVRDIAHLEDALAGVNASYFKPGLNVPLGTSIIDGKIVTGPLFRRVTFGITKDKQFKMGRIDIEGDINIANNIKLSVFNLNQPVFSSTRFNIFTDKWGKKTPRTSHFYSHIVVKDDKVLYIKNSQVPIPRGGYVVVGPHIQELKGIKIGDKVNYNVKLKPDDWNNVEYAVGGGPYLVKEGHVYIDRQQFSRSFLWRKAPRTAIGYTKSGNLILVTVDGRHKDFSEGATMSELAQIMNELGAYNAMNLDGGTSTQMVINGKVVDYPLVKGGGRVTNALLIIQPPIIPTVTAELK